MGTELNEGTSRRVGAGWAHHRGLVRALPTVLAPLAALLAAGAAQAVTLPAVPAARALSHEVVAAVQSIHTTVSGSVPAPPTPGDPAPAHPAPTVAKNGAPVPVPSPAQQTVTTALHRAGVMSGPGGSETVPVSGLPPGPAAGTAGPPSDRRLLATVADLATRLGVDPGARLRHRSGRGGAAVVSSVGWLRHRLVLRDPGRRHRAGGGGSRRRADLLRARAASADLLRAGAAATHPWRLPLAANGATMLPSSGRADAVAHSGAPARPRHPPSRRARSPAPEPATQAPLPPIPVPNGPASAAGVGGGVGAAAAMLFIIAAIWLMWFAGDRMPLEVAAWRETLLALRLERPG